MTITIQAKPLEVKAELPGYGIFYLRRLGAGAEADIMNKLDAAKLAIDEITTKYKDILDKENTLLESNDTEGLAKLRATDEYKAVSSDLLPAMTELDKAIAYSSRCHLELWRSDDPKAKEKLLNDFSADQIKQFYMQVMAEADNA